MRLVRATPSMTSDLLGKHRLERARIFELAHRFQQDGIDLLDQAIDRLLRLAGSRRALCTQAAFSWWDSLSICC